MQDEPRDFYYKTKEIQISSSRNGAINIKICRKLSPVEEISLGSSSPVGDPGRPSP
jgi:hypothetical protein